MTSSSYHIQTQARTAGYHGHKPSYKTIQAWKTPKTAPESAKAAIEARLQAASASPQALAHLQAYAPVAKNPHGRDDAGQFDFSDVLDVANPLQHLPVVGMVYRGLTGDRLHAVSQVIGGALYGGPIGAVIGTGNAIAKIQTGKDFGDHALSFSGLKKDRPNTPPLPVETKQVSKPRQASSFATKLHQGAAHGVWKVGELSHSGPEPKIDLDKLPEKHPITTVMLRPLPPVKNF